MNDQKAKKTSCLYGESFRGHNGGSNQPQQSLKPKPKPEQDPNLLQFCEGRERRGSCRRKASEGGFTRCKERSCLRNIKVPSEVASADAEAAASYPGDPAQVIQEGGYTKNKFPIRGRSLCQRMSSTTATAREKSTPSFTASKDRLNLLLGVNVAGDFTLKSMFIDHSENPRALKNYAKSTMCMFHKWNNKAWIISHLFTTWFTEYFKPIIRPTAHKKIPFKTLLLTDNAPDHPNVLMET